MKQLKTFKQFPKDSICPICGTNEEGESFLIPVIGTQEGNLCEAQPFHTGCLKLAYDKDVKIIFQRLK